VKFKTILLAMIFILLTTTICHAAGIDNLDSKGNEVLYMIRKIGFWIILFKAIGDIIQDALRGDLHSVGRTTLNYVILYGSLFFLPYAFRLVEGLF
jgi:hypothetical protein